VSGSINRFIPITLLSRVREKIHAQIKKVKMNVAKQKVEDGSGKTTTKRKDEVKGV
jgi:hypothetical protein